MRIAIIPARGGSKRIKDKNIRQFCGKPMIHYPLQAARDSGLFDVIHVSTDSREIRGVVKSLGFPVDFPRPAGLSGDHTPLMPVLRWVVEEYARRGRRFDDVLQLLPCAPLVEASDLRAGWEAYERAGRRPLIAVAEYPAPVEWAFEREESGRLRPVKPGAFLTRSQDLGKKYYDTGTFLFYPASSVCTDKPQSDRDYVSYVLPKRKAVDIDDLEDWALAEAIFRGRETSSGPR